jgi:glycosyltransferase involved in cell wall biosynthesis
VITLSLTLGLTMIVKDEARRIRETLLSVMPHLDAATIMDTGSTDDTKQIIAQVFAEFPNVKGLLLEDQFTDFSDTRNRAMRAAIEQNPTDLLVTLNGDDLLEGGEHIRADVGDVTRIDRWHVRQHHGDLEFAHVRVIRGRPLTCEYQEPTHEVICSLVEGSLVGYLPRTRVIHLGEVDRERQRSAWKRDERLFLEKLVKEPDHHRTLFYLAQTYDCLNIPTEAVHYYKKRATLGGWQEEVYEALYRAAQLARIHGIGEEAFGLYVRAIEASHATRAEPFWGLAQMAWDRRDVSGSGGIWAAYWWSSLGLKIPIPGPPNTLGFVDKTVYQWKLWDLLASSAWHVGKFGEGMAAAEMAAAACPNDARIVANLAHYRGLHEK